MDRRVIPSGMVGVLNATTPLATFALASITLHDRDVTRRRALGLVGAAAILAGLALTQHSQRSETDQTPTRHRR